jgi:glycosyltransferase involved in cell wall biosynthesis
MIRVVHLSTVHRPSDVRIFHKECSTLAAHGYHVTFLACTPESYESHGVHIAALPQPRSRVDRMTRIAFRALDAALRTKADVYHFHDPELIPVGLLLKLAGRRVIYDVHEDAASDVMDKHYLHPRIKPIVRFLVRHFEQLAVRAFDEVVAATSSIGGRFPAAKTTVVRNLPIQDEMWTPDRAPFSERDFIVAYVGGLAPLNGAEQMVRAMAELPPESKIRLVVAGRANSDSYGAMLRGLRGSARVEFAGWVDRSRVREILASSRAGLVVYQATPNAVESEPNKFFEMLSAGLPIIASDFADWRRVIDEHGCGMTVSARDPSAIANAIVELVGDPDRAEEMGRRGRALVEGVFNWERESQRLLAVYARLLGGPGKGS